MNGTNAPFGFKPDHCPGYPEAPTMTLDVLAANGTAIANGDCVRQVNDGGVSRANTDASDVILGVFKGCKYRDSGGIWQWSPYLAASQAAKASVCMHQDQVFQVQGDVTALAQTQLWNNADHVDAAPSATRKKSQQYLDVANLNTTSTLGWKIQGYPVLPDNLIGATYALYLVSNNRRAIGNAVTGV